MGGGEASLELRVNGSCASTGETKAGKKGVVVESGATKKKKWSVEGQIRLQKACLSGEAAVIEELLEEQPNEELGDGRTALFYACESGSVEAVELLLKKGADARCVDDDWTTPLHLSTASAGITRILLKAGAGVDAAMRTGATALILAAQNGHIETVDALIQGGCDVDTVDGNRAGALYFASKNGHDSVVKTLLTKTKRRVDSATAKGSWPLHAAVVNGHAPCVSLLLDKGANVSKKTREGKSLLMIAAEEGRRQVIEQLCEKLGGRDFFDKNRGSPKNPVYYCATFVGRACW